MTFTEIKSDLFKVSNDYTLVHCISADFALGAGIAKQFRDRGVRAALLAKYRNPAVGTALLTNETDWNGEINLVTKEKYWLKPTYATLKAALIDARDNVIIPNGFHKLAMPYIGCGLDRLDWSLVKPVILEVFSKMNIEILICGL